MMGHEEGRVDEDGEVRARAYIPRGDGGSPQNLLRKRYNARRRLDLTKTGRTKEETLQYCIRLVRAEHPNFNPKYDEGFFKEPKRSPLRSLLDWIRDRLYSYEHIHYPAP